MERLECRQPNWSGTPYVDWDALARGEPGWFHGDAPTPRWTGHRVLALCREHWARLGIPDPGEYEGLDLIEEAIRLVGLPAPA